MKYFIQNAGYKDGVLAVRCDFNAEISKELEGKMVVVNKTTFENVKASPESYSIDKDGKLNHV